MGPNQGHRADPRAHDASSFEAVYAAWFRHVLRWIRAFGAPAPEHDDLLQEVFVVVHRRLAQFDGDNLAGWLYRITQRQVRDHRRLRWVRKMLRRSVPVSPRLESPAPTPLAALETREKQQLLSRLLMRLSEPLRVTFMLFEVDGYSGEEIAKLQRVSLNTVRSRIHRARKRLLEVLIECRKQEREETGGESERVDRGG